MKEEGSPALTPAGCCSAINSAMGHQFRIKARSNYSLHLQLRCDTILRREYGVVHCLHVIRKDSGYEHSSLGGKIQMDILRTLELEGMKQNLPNLKVGDYLKVNVKVKEGNRERIQVFEGTLIAMRGSGISRAVTVRRLSFGIGVERVFPIHSPNVDSFEIVRRGKVRRAKLYYLRKRVGKAARIKEDIAASKE